MADQATNVKFLSSAAFKAAVGATEIRVIRNPHTGKLFGAADNDTNYKVQGDIDPALTMRWLVQDGNLNEACLVNVDESKLVEELFAV